MCIQAPCINRHVERDGDTPTHYNRARTEAVEPLNFTLGFITIDL